MVSARRAFGGAPNVLGAAIELGRSRHAVVGVAPASFTGVGLEPVDLWLVLTHSPELCSFTGQNLLSSSNSAWFSTIGRAPRSADDRAGAAEVAASDTGPFAASMHPRRRFDRWPARDALDCRRTAACRCGWPVARSSCC